MEMVDILNYGDFAITSVGIVILLYASILTAIRVLQIEISGKNMFAEIESQKRRFSQMIILALDFFVAGDLLRLILISNLNDIYFLAIIVAIRTVLSWSLGREMKPVRESP